MRRGAFPPTDVHVNVSPNTQEKNMIFCQTKLKCVEMRDVKKMGQYISFLAYKKELSK